MISMITSWTCRIKSFPSGPQRDFLLRSWRRDVRLLLSTTTTVREWRSRKLWCLLPKLASSLGREERPSKAFRCVMDTRLKSRKVLISGRNSTWLWCCNMQERAGVKMVMIQDGPQNTGADKPLRISGDPFKVQVSLIVVFKLQDKVFLTWVKLVSLRFSNQTKLVSNVCATVFICAALIFNKSIQVSGGQRK